jgi:sugar phosphate permease
LKPLYFVAWLLCALFNLYQYAARLAPGVMQDQLARAWGGNHIGLMASFYYVAYAMSALATGVLLDRYRAARVMRYAERVKHQDALSSSNMLRPFAVVFGNLQSWSASIIGGFLFAPTTIGAMVWAMSFLHNGEHVSIADTASDASMVPVDWIIGCPLLGYISERIGRRKPVLLGGADLMVAAGIAALYLPEAARRRYLVPLLLGIGSGAAMIPFAMIKEANPAEMKGIAAGVMSGKRPSWNPPNDNGGFRAALMRRDTHGDMTSVRPKRR